MSSLKDTVSEHLPTGLLSKQTTCQTPLNLTNPPVQDESMWYVDPLQVRGIVLWYAEKVQVISLLIITDLK